MKKALILGVSGTIGQAIAKKIIDEGYTVYGTFHKNELSGDLLKSKNIKLYSLDFSRIEEIDKYFESIRQVKLDFIVNTIANPCVFDKFERININTFEADFKVNVLNYIYLLQKVVPNLNQNSNIIFILTDMIHNPKSYFSSYISSKHALLGLMKCLSQEFKSKKIRVNSVSPGIMDTNFTWNLRVGEKVLKIPEKKNQQFVNPINVAETIIRILKDETINGVDVEVKT